MTTGLTGSGSVQIMKIDGAISVPAGVSGTFGIQAAISSGGSNYTIRAYSFLDIMPV